MKTNKERFMELVSDVDTTFIDDLQYRIDNRTKLRNSQKVALSILMKMKKLKITDFELAAKLNIDISEIVSILSGKCIDPNENNLNRIYQELNIEL